MYSHSINHLWMINVTKHYYEEVIEEDNLCEVENEPLGIVV